MGQGAQTGEEKTVLAPRSTLTSELTWSKGLMPAYYRKGTCVSPGLLALPHPRAHLELNAKSTRSPLEAGGKVFYAHMVLLSAPRLPQMQSSTMLFPHAVSPSAASGYPLQFFFSFCQLQHNKDSNY